MATTLYKLTGEYQRLMDIACEDDGNNPDDQSHGLSHSFIQILEQIESDISGKLEGCCRVIKSMQALQEAIDTEASILRDRSSRLTRAVDELKDYVKWNLEQIGMKKRNAGPFTVSICQNSQPSVTVLDLSAIPSKFDKQFERQVSLTAIRDAFKAGEVVPGVDVVRGSHLRIK